MPLVSGPTSAEPGAASADGRPEPSLGTAQKLDSALVQANTTEPAAGPLVASARRQPLAPGETALAPASARVATETTSTGAQTLAALVDRLLGAKSDQASGGTGGLVIERGHVATAGIPLKPPSAHSGPASAGPRPGRERAEPKGLGSRVAPGQARAEAAAPAAGLGAQAPSAPAGNAAQTLTHQNTQAPAVQAGTSQGVSAPPPIQRADLPIATRDRWDEPLRGGGESLKGLAATFASATPPLPAAGREREPIAAAPFAPLASFLDRDEQDLDQAERINRVLRDQARRRGVDLS